MNAAIRVIAPAKINLALHVTGQRADGLHLLDTLVAFSEQGDRIRLSLAERDSLEISGPFSGALANGPENIILAACDRLRRQFPGRNLPPIRIQLEKNLPVASGIGGGSGNAAMTLRGLCRLWGLALTEDELSGLGLELGADLPMCLKARPLVARGIGERITPVEELPALHLLLINPGVPVGTGEVFSMLKQKNNAPLPELPERRDPSGWVDWLSQMRNDLQEPACRIAPQITGVLAALRAAGAALARMSGSGATCYGIFADEEEMRLAAARMQAEQPGWFIMAARTAASPQVAGKGS